VHIGYIYLVNNVAMTWPIGVNVAEFGENFDILITTRSYDTTEYRENVTLSPPSATVNGDNYDKNDAEVTSPVDDDKTKKKTRKKRKSSRKSKEIEDVTTEPVDKGSHSLFNWVNRLLAQVCFGVECDMEICNINRPNINQFYTITVQRIFNTLMKMAGSDSWFCHTPPNSFRVSTHEVERRILSFAIMSYFHFLLFFLRFFYAGRASKRKCSVSREGRPESTWSHTGKGAV